MSAAIQNEQISTGQIDTNGTGTHTERASDLPAELTTKLEVGGLEVIERNAHRWEELCEEALSAPFYRPEWVSTYLRAFEPTSEVLLLTATRGSRLVALLPLVRKRCLYAGIPVTKLTGPANVHSVRFDVVCSPSPLGEAAIEQLWKLLRRVPGWHVLELPTFPQDGACEKLMACAERDGYSTIRLHSHDGPILRLEPDRSGRRTWLHGTNRHFRHELRRFSRLLEDEMGGKPEFIRRTDTDPEVLRKFFALEEAGWKGKKGTAINSDARTLTFYEQVARVAASRGNFRLHSLELDGTMAAGAFSVRNGGCFFPLKISYDETLHRGGPGQVLFNAILEECAGNGIAEFYFGGQADRYKMCWTSETIAHFNGFIFAAGFWPRLAHTLRTNVVSPLGRLRRFIRSRCH
jgi:CelD/BcsL family acetyltransferase involved in cellulose biosynthesis